MKTSERNPWLLRLRGWLVHGIGLFALLGLLIDYARNNLTANPIQALTQRTGEAALILLIASLACTPLNRWAGWKWIQAWRKPLGLYAFLYVGLHLATFSVLDFGLNWEWISAEIAEKRYILVGFAAFLLLLPLAITSTKGWQRRLGRNWARLHKIVYVAAPLAVLHFLWSVKADYREPLLYAAILGGLLLLRLPQVRQLAQRGQGFLKSTKR